MKNRMLFFSVVLVGTVSPLSLRAAAMQATPMLLLQSAASVSQEEALYTSGTKAMDEQRWADAVTAFDQVAAAKGKHGDAAVYWKAYALDKLGRKDEATSTCDSLAHKQPPSPWMKECIVLRARGSAMDARKMAELERETSRSDRGNKAYIFSLNGPRGPHPTSEDDIKILALNSLMQQEPAKALPLLHDLILSDKPIDVRRQALFVLSRSKQPEAQSMLMEVATSTKDPALQEQAIQIIAIQRGKDAGPTLVQIYHSSSDAKVKRAAINGLFIEHDATRLVELARSEKDLNLKRDIVSQLALMHDPAATSYMEELLK